MLGFIYTDFRQSRFYQEVFAEGLEEGRREGRVEGRHEECHALVLRLLQRRFGFVPATQSRQIGRLSLAHTEALAEDLLDFEALEDIGPWLLAHSERTVSGDPQRSE